MLSSKRVRRMRTEMAAIDIASEEASRELNKRMSACLVAIASSADRAAFRTLFEFYAPRIKSFLMRSGGDAGRAEEITQETMVAIWRKADQFDPHKASASTWIFTIARNLRIDAFRREKHPELDPEDPALGISAPESAFARLAEAQDAALLTRAIAELNDSERQLLALTYYGDKSQSRIADELGLPLGTVKTRLRAVYARLRHRLQDLERDAS